MPGWLLVLSPRTRQALSVIGIAVLIYIIGFTGVWLFNNWVERQRTEAVETHDRDITLDAMNRAADAAAAATSNQVAADAAFTNSQEGLRDEVRTKGTSNPVGPATAGVLERLRREQAATAKNRDTAR